MGRQKSTICRRKTAGGQYGTPKVDNLSKNRRRPIWDAKLTKSWQFVEKKPPEVNMRRQKLTICRTKTRRRPKCDTKVTQTRKNITNKKKIRNFNENKKLSISLITAFHTDSEFRSPNPRCFFYFKKCRICVLSVRVLDYTKYICIFVILMFVSFVKFVICIVLLFV